MVKTLRLWEVGPRDGLQSIHRVLKPEDRIAFIKDLHAAGLTRIEVGSFVNPKLVPAMAETAEVLRGTRAVPEVSVIIMNERGLDEALAAGAGGVGIVTIVTDSFSTKNNGCDAETTIKRAAVLAKRAKAAGLRTRISISPAWHCPYEGPVPADKVLAFVSALAPLEPDELSLSDTTGKAEAAAVFQLFSLAAERSPRARLAAHFHDTFGKAVANAEAALAAEVRIFDSSAGGIGGCPFAPGAKGNIATEDMVMIAERHGYHTGVDLMLLRKASRAMAQRLAENSADLS